MVLESRVNEYLRKAGEAEIEEKRSRDPQVRWAWERIAVGYLELAEMARHRND